MFYILAIPAAFIAWGHNIATAIFVRDMMRLYTGGEYVGKYGNAVWLTLAGTVSAKRGRRPSGSSSGRRGPSDRPRRGPSRSWTRGPSRYP